MYTIAVGNPWDGITLYGIYDTFDDAELAAFQSFDGMDWWVLSIH